MTDREQDYVVDDSPQGWFHATNHEHWNPRPGSWVHVGPWWLAADYASDDSAHSVRMFIHQFDIDGIEDDPTEVLSDYAVNMVIDPGQSYLEDYLADDDEAADMPAAQAKFDAREIMYYENVHEGGGRGVISAAVPVEKARVIHTYRWVGDWEDEPPPGAIDQEWLEIEAAIRKAFQ